MYTQLDRLLTKHTRSRFRLIIFLCKVCCCFSVRNTKSMPSVVMSLDNSEWWAWAKVRPLHLRQVPSVAWPGRGSIGEIWSSLSASTLRPYGRLPGTYIRLEAGASTTRRATQTATKIIQPISPRCKTSFSENQIPCAHRVCVKPNAR
jgi:hypothetical protein